MKNERNYVSAGFINIVHAFILNVMLDLQADPFQVDKTDAADSEQCFWASH